MTLDQENQLKTEIASLRAENAALRQRLQALEARLAQDSHNSSKPPSTDGFIRSPKKRSLRKASGKQSGGQTGHSGQSLSLTDSPDQLIVHAATSCHNCQLPLTLSEVEVTNVVERRQVWDLPRTKLEVTEHQKLLTHCPACGEANLGSFPTTVTSPVQYGPQVRAMAVYLLNYQLLPYARTCEVLNELFDCRLSQGTLAQILADGYERLAAPEQVIKTALTQVAVLHNDETGFFVEAVRRWLHTACTKWLTHYAWHTRRGKAATDDIGILPNFEGISVHDGYQSYPQYQCQHALCNAHHLRELTFVAEQLGQSWAGAMISLLCELKAEVEQAQTEGLSALAATRLKYYEQVYTDVLASGKAANPPPLCSQAESECKRGRPKQTKAKNLLDRLERQRVEVLRFGYNFEVPFDNNQAERDLRMMKLQQKISGNFRSRAGADYFCRIRGYLSTMRKQGQQVFKVLVETFSGRPPLPQVLT